MQFLVRLQRQRHNKAPMILLYLTKKMLLKLIKPVKKRKLMLSIM
ncbi:hypothetical protein UNSWCS_2049 [Campylobacter concisus UNSWCS]|uniref:Uncharacterized protein n=1 Tax=Campylobacter concisus UNSWCS TaxID=1242968 RepID=U2EXQ4_9BACT|nr:hypothetical protein UNSWCS_2049 [Campylobacter concisus UNSWCS]